MFKKKTFAVALAAGLLGLAACGGTSTSGSADTGESTDVAEGITVTFYIGDEVVDTQTIESGAIPEAYDYTPDEGALVGWYLTPTFSRVYLFDEGLTEDTSLFGGVSVYEEDTREYYLAGTGTSELLSKSSWGNYQGDDVKLTKAESTTENVYTMTTDFYSGDQFQITSFVDGTTTWGFQYGYGYIRNYREMTDYLTSSSGLDSATRKSNISVTADGNYTITLRTYPDHDDETEGTNFLSNMEIVRNGDPVSERPELTYSYYIKGAGITDWNDMYNSATELAITPEGTYVLSTFLKAEEEFMFTSLATAADGTVSTGSVYLRYGNLDEASRAYFADADDASNMTTLAAGGYTFTYAPGEDDAAGTISVAYDAEATLAVGDFYINGTIDSAVAGDWSTSSVTSDGSALKDDHKLAATGEEDEYSATATFREGDQFTIACFAAGSTSVGDGWINQIGSYNYNYGYGLGEAWSAADPAGSNYNFLCNEAGEYTITINNYSKIVTIAAVGE